VIGDLADENSITQNTLMRSLKLSPPRRMHTVNSDMSRFLNTFDDHVLTRCSFMTKVIEQTGLGPNSVL
jgi:hypothetical protein